MLNPELTEAYKNSDQPKITTEAKGKFGGRFLGIPLRLPNFDDNGKKLKQDVRILISSVYHPVDYVEYDQFNDLLPTLLSKAPPKYHILLGQDNNANVGIRKGDDDPTATANVIGPNGIDNRNKNGTELINLLGKKSYGIWKTRTTSHITCLMFGHAQMTSLEE